MTITISPKFQVVIPKAIRDAMRLRSGQKVEILRYDNRIEIIPLQPIHRMRGFLKRMNTDVVREPDRV